jgi:hypothetical protein
MLYQRGKAYSQDLRERCSLRRMMASGVARQPSFFG